MLETFGFALLIAFLVWLVPFILVAVVMLLILIGASLFWLKKALTPTEKSAK